MVNWHASFLGEGVHIRRMGKELFLLNFLSYMYSRPD